jgi:hypothetical protein
VGKTVVVSNTRGIDARRPTGKAGHGTHDTTSSLTQFTLADDSAIRSQTGKVFQQNGWTGGSVSLAHGKGKQRPVPVVPMLISLAKNLREEEASWVIDQALPWFGSFYSP